MKRTITCHAVLLLTLGCSHGGGPSTQPGPGNPVGISPDPARPSAATPGRSAAPPPVADHHVHLSSLTILRERTLLPLLPVVDVPDELDRLLRARERIMSSPDSTVIDEVFTEAGQMIDLAPTPR